MFIKAMIYMNVRRIRHVPYFKTVKKLRELFMRQVKKIGAAGQKIKALPSSFYKNKHYYRASNT